MKPIVIIISAILFGGILHAQDCHSIPLEEVALELTPEVNGYYETEDAAIPSGDVAQATSNFIDGLETSIASQASIPIELVYVRDRDHGIATDVWYHQKVNGDTLQHWYTRIRVNAKNEVDYVYVKLALEIDSVQAHPLKITKNPNFNTPNNTQINWGIKLGTQDENACPNDIMELQEPYTVNTGYQILKSISVSGDNYVKGRFANMFDCLYDPDDDKCIEVDVDDEDYDCNSGTGTPEDVQKKYIGGNMMFYVNDFIYWLAEKFNNGNQGDLENYLDGFFIEKIQMIPINDVDEFRILGPNADGNFTISLGSNSGAAMQDLPHQGHDPDYILAAAHAVYAKIAPDLGVPVNDNYVTSFSDVLTRLYWESFLERHTDEDGDEEDDRIKNAENNINPKNRVKTFGGTNPSDHLVVPDPSNLPEYDSTLTGDEYVQFLNQLWYGIYSNYDDKQGFYDLLELVWLDLGTISSGDHAAFMELVEKYLSSQFYDRVTDQGRGTVQAYEGLSREEYEAILAYILRLHGENADEFISLPLEDYYIKDAGGANCSIFTSSEVDTCSENDRGFEPNEESGGFASQSIWNCPPGQPDCERHESPVYKLEDENPQENTLRVRVHPIFDVDDPDSIEGTLDLYCVVTTTSISWASWGGEGPFEYVLPDCAEGSKELVIGRKVGSVPLSQFSEKDSSGVRIYNLPWIPFNPQDFKGCYSDWDGARIHSCVLAVLQTDQDSFDVGDKSWRLVPENNNAAARNMSTLWDDTNEMGSGRSVEGAQNAQIVHFMSGNSPSSSALNDTVSISLANFRSSTGQSAEKYLKEGQLSLWMSEELRTALKHADISKSSVSPVSKGPEKDGWLRIESADFRLDNVVMKRGQVYRSLVSYDLDRDWEEGEMMGFDIIQSTASGCESGGVRFEARAGEERISHSAASNDLLLYPNPADHQIRIELPDGISMKEIEVYRLSGQLIRQRALSNQAASYDMHIHSLIPGIYFIRVTDKSGAYHYGKMIKN